MSARGKHLPIRVRARKALLIAVATTAALLAAPAVASADDLFVSTSGTDSGACGPAGDPCASVQQAVTNAAGGDTIEVAPGTYVGSGQVVIGKNLTLNGAGAGQTTLKPGFDTASNDSWIRVDDGFSLDVNDLRLNGASNDVWFAIRYHGSASGAIDSVAFRNISFSQYLGFAVSTNKGGDPDPASGNLDITNSSFEDIQRVGVLYKGADVTGTFSGNTYVGKGLGDQLDYALDISAGADVTVTGNTVRANRGEASDGSTSAAFLATTFWGPGTEATVSGNNLTDNTTGIHVGFDATDTSAVGTAFNRLAGNDEGVVSTAPAVNAENNWWGCNAGPGGPGCDVTTTSGPGSVDSDPWLVLGASANPATITAGGSSQVTASLAGNSNGATPGGNVFPSGINVAFATTLGSIVSPVATTSPFATSTLSSATPGTATVTATLDGQPASTAVTVNAVPTPAAGGALGQVQPGTTKKKCKKGRKLKKGKCVKKKRKK